eukprot:Opistho-2@937
MMRVSFASMGGRSCRGRRLSTPHPVTDASAGLFAVGGSADRADQRAHLLALRTVGSLLHGRVDGDDEVFLRVNIDALAEDADGAIAVFHRPPEVTVSVLVSLLLGDVVGGGVFDPAGGQDGLAVDHAAAEHESADAGIVAERHRHAAAAALMASLVDHPDRVLLHAIGRPEFFGGVLGYALAGEGAAKGNACKIGLASFIDPFAARHGLALKFRHVSDERVHATLPFRQAGLCYIRFRVGVVLVPFHAGRHSHHAAEADVVIDGAFELRDVFGDRVVDRGDVAILHGGADERGGDGLGDGKRCPAVGGLAAEGVFLEDDLPSLMAITPVMRLSFMKASTVEVLEPNFTFGSTAVPAGSSWTLSPFLICATA